MFSGMKSLQKTYIENSSFHKYILLVVKEGLGGKVYQTITKKARLSNGISHAQFAFEVGLAMAEQ